MNLYSHMEIYSLCNLYAYIEYDMHLLIYSMNYVYILFLSTDFPSISSIRPDARFWQSMQLLERPGRRATSIAQ